MKQKQDSLLITGKDVRDLVKKIADDRVKILRTSRREARKSARETVRRFNEFMTQLENAEI